MRNRIRNNTKQQHCQLPTTVARISVLVSTILFFIQSTSIVAFQNPIASRKGITFSRRSMKKSMEMHMGLYEEDIDWDADLFRKLPNNPSSSNKYSLTNNTASSTEDSNADTGQWDMGQSNKSSMQTMRDKMKQQMGETSAGKPEGNSDVGWVPNYGKIVDEDEPWFTG